MPNELIATLIKFLPTIVFGLIVLLGVLGGFLKGFRKSSILFVHYLLALGVGFAAYFILRKQMSTMDLNFLFGLIGGEYSNAHTVYDFIRILIEQTSLASYSALVGNYYIQGVIDAFAGLIFSLVLGILCLIVLPILLRIIFRFFYIIFYSERKHKKHKRAEGEEYRRHRFLGMGVGLLRGAVCATLMVSFITSLFFTISGGEFTSSEEEANIELFNYLESTYGADVNLYYNALKQSRNTGVGLLYEKVQVKGKPLDYFYYDLFLATDFKSYDFSKDGSTAQLSQTINQTIPDGVISTLSIRQESALVFELIEGLLEANVITMENGAIKVHNEVLFESGIEVTKNYVEGSVFFKDIMPLVLTGIVDEAQKGNISIQEDIDKYIKENDLSSKMRKVDFVNDISQMLNTMIPLVEILVDEQTGQFNTDKLSNPLELLNLAPDVIDTVLNGLSEITLITEVIFPIGIGYVFNSFEVQLNQAGIATDDIDLLSVDWKLELKNLAKTFKCISQLELDFAKLQDTTIQPSGKTMQMEYITNFIKEEANKTKLLNLVDTVMASNLTGQFSLVMVKKFIGDLNITDETGAQNAELAGSLQKIKDNLNARDANGNLIYTTKHLASDLHVFVDSCLGLFDLIGAFSGDTTDPIGMLKGIPTDSLRVALIGDEYDGTKESVGGLYKIQFLSGDLNGDGKVDAPLSNVTDEMIETLLLVYAKDVFSSDDIKEVKNGKGWPEELDSLIKCIELIQGNEELSNLSLSGDLTAITLSDTAIDDLTLSCSKSVLIGNLLTTKIKEGLSGEENNITIPENTEWLDTFDETGNLASRGELNKMLKILNVFNDPKNGIDLNNSDSIVAGLAKLNTEEVDTLTASTVLTGSLNGIMCEMLELEEGSLGDINWASEDGKEGELQIFVNILNISVLQTKEEGSEVSKFDAEKLTDVDTIAQLIKTTNDEDKYQDAEQIAKSQVVMSVISDKISSISSSDVEIVIPQNLNDNWQAWSKSEAGVYKDGEFIKMVYSLHCARNYVLTIKEVVDGTEQNKYTKLTTENLIEGILGMPENTEEYSPVTESLVMYATLSNKLDQLSKEENPTIQIREAAYVKEEDLAANNNIAIYKEEVSLALCAIGDLGITDFNNVNTGIIVDNIKQNPEARKNLCNSNIMNKTIVDKLITNASGTLEFPEGYKNSNTEAWYPTEDSDSWQTCELNLILNSIVELSSGDNAGIIIEGDTITSNTNKLFKDLSNNASDSTNTKLFVIYQSQVMASTISAKIVDQEESKTIEIKNDAFVDKNRNNNLEYQEIELLVNFLNDNSFKIDNDDKETEGKELNAENLLKLVDADNAKAEDNRATMCNSNILNITIISKVTASSDIKIPNELKAYNETTEKYELDIEDSDWYSVDSDWKKGQLNKLLVAIGEMDITVSGNNVSVDTENVVYDLNNRASNGSNKKIQVVYESLVMSQTISDYIIENDSLDIPTSYMVSDSDEERMTIIDEAGRITVGEISSLVNSIDVLKINLGSEDKEGKVKPSDLTPGYIVSLTTDEIEAIFNSAIISYKTSTILDENQTVVVPTNVNFKVSINGIDGEKPAIYSSDIAAVILAIKALDLDVDGELQTFSLADITVVDNENEENDKTLSKQLENSSIFHATMSSQVTLNVSDVPHFYYKDLETRVDLTVDFISGDGEEFYLTADEISNLVLVLQALGIDNASDASDSIDENFITKLNETKAAYLGNSGIIAAMVTNQMTSINLDNTKHIYHNVSMLKTSNNMNKVINGSEVTALVNAINALGIKDFTNVNSSFLSGEGDGEHITVAKLLESKGTDCNKVIDIVLDSYTIHAMLSDNLIHQTQSVTNDMSGPKYHIVTYTYRINNLHPGDPNADEVTVTIKDDNKVDETGDIVKFIEKEQIVNLLEGLTALGINEVSQASEINADILVTVAKNENGEISKVENSAILCTIMSNILLHNERFAYLEFPYKHYEEYCAADNAHMEILSYVDIHNALEIVASLEVPQIPQV